MFPVHTILHPTDFSKGSEAAFQVACALGRDLCAGIVVLHVVPPPIAHAEVVAWNQPDGYHEQLWTELQKIHAPGDNVRVEHRLAEGDIVEEILRAVDETKAGLIVLGTHGRTGLMRVLLGSVAEEVLRRSPCPVLTIRTPAPKEEKPAPREEFLGVGLS